jgi:hypothetical protein
MELPFASRRLSLAIILCATLQAQYPGPDGSAFGPALNTIPCRHFTGFWNDNFGTGNSYSLSTNVSAMTISGTASVAHPGGAGCPNLSYTVSGSFSLVGGANASTRGTTTYTINLTNPSPSGACNSWTPVGVQFTGDLRNDGCDVAAGQWRNVTTPPSGSGSISFAKFPDLPTGESTTPVGWSTGFASTVHQWRNTLQGALPFDGRQVYEAQGPNKDDGCYFPGAADDGFIQFQITGAWWLVGRYATPPTYLLSNYWIDDYVGFSTTAVGYYRLKGRAPCSAYSQQLMHICRNGNGCVYGQQYKAGYISAGITSTQVYSGRDGTDVYRNW